MTQDPDLQKFLETFAKLSDLAREAQHRPHGPLLQGVLEEHLGVHPAQLSTVATEVPPYRYADYDVAFELLAGEDSLVIGLGGGDQRLHNSLSDMVSNPWGNVPVVQVDWTHVPTGPSETRRAVGIGMRLFTYRGIPVGVMLRRPTPPNGSEMGRIDVISADPEVSGALLDEAAKLSIEKSLLRGNVLMLEMVGFGGEGDGYRFVERPRISSDDVILPAGALDRIRGHITGIGLHSESLRRHGQHLKRGILLYGPPGTGKTHTVRHLISEAEDHTVILLSGRTLALIGQATAIARNLQPSIVVLEDCDLVAMDRDFSGSGPLLFEVLDALDGLATDSEVAFLLTTNRVDVLEEALAQRPGRVDLAVELPKPDLEARRRLLELYCGDIAFSAGTLDEVARMSDAHTASFFKELIRRAVLQAAEAGVEPADKHLLDALASLNADNERLTLSLIGAGGDGGDEPDEHVAWDAVEG